MAPSRTWIKVVNDARIKSLGRWTGKVKVGGIEAESTFKVFDCQGAFDIILGKPWLRKVCAVHDYSTDTIIIGTDSHQEALTNLTPPETLPPRIPTMTFIITNEQDLEHTTGEEQGPEETQPPPTSSKTCTNKAWVPQLEYEEEKHRQHLAQAQREHKHHRILREARERAMKAKSMATKHNAQRANDEGSEDQLEAEWTRIQLLQVSDDPWIET